jgi:O-antigen/teichoic acid export membrane protein
MFAYLLVSVVREFNQSQLAMLNKNMAFRQIARTDVVSSLVMTLVGPGLAWLGWGVWAIVAELFSGLVTRLLIIQLAYPPWRPRLGWEREQVRWFWDYGKKAWHSSNMAYFLGHFDDWYVGTFLGSQPLGYYSRAYEYAGYSQRVIANPIMNVFYPTFAHVQEDRQKLSRAFFRPISLMIRAGGLFCLIFILTAPEFIPLLLGEKWLPMLRVFQLLVLYTLLEPLSMGARNLLLATGHPQEVVRARLVQMVVFIPAVFLLGYQFNMEGVAVAANLMAIVGTVLLFRYTRPVVDYSPRLLWFWPLLATMVTAVLVLALNPLWQILNLWLSLALKMGLTTAVYGLILYLTERQQLNNGRKMIWGIIAPMIKERGRLGD